MYREMSPPRLALPAAPRILARTARLRAEFGLQVRDQRLRRRWRLADLAERAGVSSSEAHRVESGAAASLEACVRIAVALGMEFEFGLRDPHLTRPQRQADPLHAALGEIEARQLAPHGCIVRVDEPYQHYQSQGERT